ncbi:DUF362 domain-containing protein [Candidatus Poribacteria bacterium]|nr:DUF362 domain-containing protein [Candidatus Poribacteria bacterium]
MQKVAVLKAQDNGDTADLMNARGRKLPITSPRVSIQSVVSNRDNLQKTVAEAIEKAGAGNIISKGDSVLLKPNLHGSVGITDLSVIEAIARWIWDCGAREIIIGDGPFYGIVNGLEHFEKIGVMEVAKKVNAQCVAFDEHDFRIFHNVSKHLPDELGITRFAYDCDKMINAPIMKTHFNTLVTLGMKNLKGCIRKREKRIFHQINLDRAIVELNRLLQADLTIMDATRAMEGMGPAGGAWVDMGLILASTDVVAMDAVCCYLMGIDPDEVMTLRFAQRTGLGETNINKIEIVGENLDEHKRHFERPIDSMRRQYPQLNLSNEGACSGCNMNLFAALRGLKWQGGELAWDEIVMGNGKPKSADALLIGSCTSSLRKEYPYLPGCPPDVEEIREKLVRNPFS